VAKWTDVTKLVLHAAFMAAIKPSCGMKKTKSTEAHLKAEKTGKPQGIELGLDSNSLKNAALSFQII
jgi:uncharacterized protein YbbK (DUF523 family)